MPYLLYQLSIIFAILSLMPILQYQFLYDYELGEEVVTKQLKINTWLKYCIWLWMLKWIGLNDRWCRWDRVQEYIYEWQFLKHTSIPAADTVWPNPIFRYWTFLRIGDGTVWMDFFSNTGSVSHHLHQHSCSSWSWPLWEVHLPKSNQSDWLESRSVKFCSAFYLSFCPRGVGSTVCAIKGTFVLTQIQHMLQLINGKKKQILQKGESWFFWGEGLPDQEGQHLDVGRRDGGDLLKILIIYFNK